MIDFLSKILFTHNEKLLLSILRANTIIYSILTLFLTIDFFRKTKMFSKLLKKFKSFRFSQT